MPSRFLPNPAFRWENVIFESLPATAFYITQGKKRTGERICEDRAVALSCLAPITRHAFGLADGHGGAGCAIWAVHMLDKLLREPYIDLDAMLFCFAITEGLS